LAERHWQTMISMARNWLAQLNYHLLFGSMPFIMLQRYVVNYSPYKLEDGTYSTLFELVHKKKPDLRALLKPFSLAAVHRECQGDDKLQKFDSQSLPMIANGHCPNSNGLQFYNPVHGTFISSINYTFQNHTTSGAHFVFKYQPGTFIFIYCLDESTTIFVPNFLWRLLF